MTSTTLDNLKIKTHYLSSHLPHYLPLLGMFILVLLGFKLFPYDKLFQIILVISAGVSYVFWGIIHHMIHKDLHGQTLLEYLALAFFGVITIITMIYRS